MNAPEHQRTIFLIEEDDDMRPVLKHNLQTDGYRVLLAFDEEDALQRVEGNGVYADLVLINLVGKSTDEALDIGRRIRSRAKYDGHTPLVVMADKYGPDMEGKDVHAGDNDWITYPEDHDQLKNLLTRLLDKTSS